MANIWPTLLPPFNQVENFVETPADTVMRSAMEEGPDKLRQNPNPKPGTLRFQQRHTTAQTNILDQFWTRTLAKGVLTFQDYHPRTDQLQTFRLRSRPTYQHVGGPQWLTTLEVEVLPG